MAADNFRGFGSAALEMPDRRDLGGKWLCRSPQHERARLGRGHFPATRHRLQRHPDRPRRARRQSQRRPSTRTAPRSFKVTRPKSRHHGFEQHHRAVPQVQQGAQLQHRAGSQRQGAQDTRRQGRIFHPGPRGTPSHPPPRHAIGPNNRKSHRPQKCPNLSRQNSTTAPT